MKAFPLQHKKLQRLSLPYLRVGTCEVMNTSSYCMMDSFHAFNTKNTSIYDSLASNGSSSGAALSGPCSTSAGIAPAPFMGQLVAGGLVDSYTGGAVSRFVSAYLSRAMSMHTIVPAQMRELRKEFPGDPLVDLMMAAAQRHRAMRPLHLQRGAPSRAANQGTTAEELRSVLSDTEMQQYAVSVDAAFFRACEVIAQAQRQATDGVLSTDDGVASDEKGVREQPERGRRAQGPRKHTPYEKKIADLLSKSIEESSPVAPPAVAGEDAFSVGSLKAVRDSGCRAVWFAATVVPSALELQRRLSLLQEQPDPDDGSGAGLPPPPRKTIGDQRVLLQAEIDKLRTVLNEQPFCLDVVVSNVGDARAFGVARNRLSDGDKSILDPSRERVVPLSVDHRPFRQEEFHRITQAGGKVESAAGEVIDGNPFYNVSRSFGHWPMKNNPQRSPVQQKLSALPHTSTWRMLVGDVLVLANHAVFETRHEDDSSVDEIAKVVGRELNRGAEPEQIAAAVCDFAIRFGAPHTLQVMVAVATKPADTATAATPGEPLSFSEWVEPGPLYVEACRNFVPFREAFLRDCARCNVSPAEMVGRRWARVRDLLPKRHALALMPYYGRECGALQQVMDEEGIFFDQDALRKADEARRGGTVADWPEAQLQDSFQRLAKSLLGAKRAG